MNLQPAVDKLCATCLAGPPYMETGVAEYSKALPREGGREEKKKEDEEEEEGREAGEGESEGKEEKEERGQ